MRTDAMVNILTLVDSVYTLLRAVFFVKELE